MCTWRNEDSYTNVWETDCGHTFLINEDTPLENNMRFCCFCGEAIAEITVTEDEDEDDDTE